MSPTPRPKFSSLDAQKWATNIFIQSSSLTLIITALAKMLSALGQAAILDSHDVLFGISTRLLMLLAGGLELMIAALLFSKIATRIKILLLLWLGMSFLFYKMAVLAIHAPTPCPCLGTITASIHIRPETARFITNILLSYYISGSLAYLSIKHTS